MEDKLTEITWMPRSMQAEERCRYHDLEVFHYTSPEGLLGILQRDGTAKLWFTQYDSLNDTTERTDILDFLKRYCEERVQQKKMSPEFSDMIGRIALSDKELISFTGTEVSAVANLLGSGIDSYVAYRSEPCDTYLCCFSKEADLLPMWNYYTKSNRCEGYSIGFLSSVFEPRQCFEKGYSIELKRVIYSDDEKSDLCDEILIPLSDMYSTDTAVDEKESIKNMAEDQINSLQFVFKNQCFEHEQEVRAILRVPRDSVGDGKMFERKYRTSNGYIVPYIEYTIPKDNVTKVTVSPLLQPDISKKNIESMLEQYGHAQACVETSVVPIRF